jgi:hypothetical protein
VADDTAIRYRGVIRLGQHGEGDDILFLGDEDDPLAELVSDNIREHGSFLSVRYWTADQAAADPVIEEAAIREMLGEGDATFGARYSEDTGYLWTDEELNVGGHDLLGELESHEGRYCLLEIRYSHEVPGA